MKPFKQRSKRSQKFKSGFEEKFASFLERLGITFGYETLKLKYVKEANYSVDFSFNSPIIIETKGYFTAADRQKMLDVKKAHPEKDIRFVFMADQKIHKLSKTRYSDWCIKHDFKYCISKDATMPVEWIQELKQATKDNEEKKTTVKLQRNKKSKV
jgi:hypothetical protein